MSRRAMHTDNQAAHEAVFSLPKNEAHHAT